jgi:Cu/Ag efflux pump CusA
MIAALIRWSVGNRFLVLIATLFLVAAGMVVGGAHAAGRACPTCRTRRSSCARRIPARRPRWSKTW